MIRVYLAVAAQVIFRGSSSKLGFSSFGLSMLDALQPGSKAFEAIPGFLVFVWASYFQDPEAARKSKQTPPKSTVIILSTFKQVLAMFN
jgi:hypothetical protein